MASAYLQTDSDESLIEQADPDVGYAVRAIIDAIETRKARAS